MTPRELNESLENIAPILFSEQKCVAECGIGWYFVIQELCLKVESLNLSVGRKWRFKVVAVCLKEKWGTLRFYSDVHADTVFSILDIMCFPIMMLAKLFRLCKIFRAYDALLGFHDLVCDYWRVISPWHRLRERRIAEVQKLVEKYAKDAEFAAHHLCEKCGREIGTKENRRAVTHGWVKYYCENCAKAEGRKYDLEVDSTDSIVL